MDCSEPPKQYILVTGDEVRQKDPEAFQACVEMAKEKYYEKVKEKISSDYPDNKLETANPKKTSIIRAVTRLAKLCAPTDKRLILAAVQIGVNSAGEVAMVRSPAQRMAALSSGWSPTFGVKEVNEKKAHEFCEQMVRACPMAPCQPCHTKMLHIVPQICSACLPWARRGSLLQLGSCWK